MPTINGRSEAQIPPNANPAIGAISHNATSGSREKPVAATSASAADQTV
jgi:hypothetical protein